MVNAIFGSTSEMADDMGIMRDPPSKRLILKKLSKTFRNVQKILKCGIEERNLP